MTSPAALGARSCRGCGRLLHARDRCACDTQVVHVVTTLGRTPDLPGLRVTARIGRITEPEPEWLESNGIRIPIWRYDR